MISWVMPVNPSHPYLENDPAPSFAPTICAFHLGFSLVLEELGINILTHGGKGKERRPEIEIVLTSEDHALTIEVLDDGHPFDPLQDSPKPDLTATIEGRPIGGLGIHLVRNLMDDLHYQRDAGKNRLTLVARRD